MTSRLPILACAALLGVLAGHAAAAPGAVQPFQPIPGASPVPATAGTGLRDRADLEAFVDGVMKAHLTQNRLAGATVAVVKDGALFFAKGYGYADVEKRVPVDAETHLFRPGSVSKMFTWTAVMQLVEQGKLDLDKDVNEYLTQFKIPAAFDAPVTLRNALTHTPGFEDGGVGYLFVKTAADLQPPEEALAEHMPARVRPPTTDFNQGGNSSYSNYATALAGLIVANVSGLSFDDYVEQHIFAPLDMTSSTFRQPLPAALEARMATGYTFENGAWKPLANGFEIINFAPAGSMSTTATDMARFMIAHLNLGAYQGRRILQENTARLMQSRAHSPNPHVNGHALGFYETWHNGRRLIAHAGDTLAFHSDMTLFPDEKIGIFVSYNTSHEGTTTIARRDLLRAFMDRYYPAALPKIEPPADFKARAGKYAGSYRANRHSHRTVEKMFTLAGGTKIVPTEDGALLMAGGNEPTQWVEVAPNVFRGRYTEDTIAFVENEHGEVTNLVLNFAPIALYKLAWHQNPLLHQVILGIAALCFIVALVSAVRNWKADRAGDPAPRRARRVAALTALLQLAFLALLVGSLAAGIRELIFGFPVGFRVALALPLLAIPLTAAMLYFAWRGWAGGWWTRYGRAQYSVIALFSLLFLWSLHSVNLIGWNFG